MQKLSLHDLLGLMETYEGTDEALASVKADLTAIAALFEGVAEPAASAEVTQENGVALIGAASANTTLSDDQLRAITEKASTVRNAYIN